MGFLMSKPMEEMGKKQQELMQAQVMLMEFKFRFATLFTDCIIELILLYSNNFFKTFWLKVFLKTYFSWNVN